MDAMTQFHTPPWDVKPQRQLTLLLSAYACEPDKGSEPGVGWQWALNLARRGHKVWVITRTNNRATIEQALDACPDLPLQFVYYDLPPWAYRWKKGGRGVHLYYFLWQWGAYRMARRLREEADFDLVHHITFGVFRQPSFMAFLGIPFVFGPVGGGEATPWRLRRGLPLRGQAVDLLRDIANWLVRVDPLMHAVFARAGATLCKTPDTLHRIPQVYRSKCRVQLEVGMQEGSGLLPVPRENDDEVFRVLFVGRFLYLKGLHLALGAFAEAFRGNDRARFTLIGNGPDEAWARQQARRLQIEDQLEWIPWLDRAELLSRYSCYDVLLFPSLHDSSGNVVLEAMAAGLPVVCLDLGGPGVLVDEGSGIAVSPGRAELVINALSKALRRLADEPELRARLSRQARWRALRHFSWRHQVRRMEQIYYETLA